MITPIPAEGRATARDCWDVVVIGAGPAGAIAARGLARAGAHVALVERRRFPRPKVCGGCLSSRAIAWLRQQECDAILEKLGAVPLTRFQVALGTRRVELELPLGAAVSRESLDQALAQAATTAGAVLYAPAKATLAPARSAATFREVLLERDGYSAETLRARVVLVADGLGHPSLSHCREFEEYVAPGSRVGVAATCELPIGDVGPGLIAMHVGTGGYVGLTRLEDGRTNIAAAVDTRALRAAGGPRPLIERLLASTGCTAQLPDQDAWRGTPPLTRHLRKPASHRVLVLGDAARFVEPFTGEGMAWAFGGGALVVPLVLRTLATDWTTQVERAWCVTHRQFVGPRWDWCRVLALVVRNPWLARGAMLALGICPALSRPIVASLSRPQPVREAFVS